MTGSRIDGSRHLDMSTVDAPVGRFAMHGDRSIRLVVGLDAAATVSAQHTAWMTVNMLARITGIITSIDVVAPAVDVFDDVDLFNVSGTGPPKLDELLRSTVNLVAGDGIQVGADHARPVDVALVVGDGEPGDADHVTFVTARRWAAWVGTDRPRHGFTDEPSPVGAYLAAALGAAEAFKYAAGLLRGHHFTNFAISAWDRTFAIGPIDALDDIGPATFDADVGDLHLAGAGAVGQAFVALLRAARPRGRAVVVDRDPVDSTNLNRYLLAVLDDIEKIKCDLAAEQLAAAGLTAVPIPHWWQDYVAGAADHLLPDDLRRARLADRYDTVCSFVDKNPARHSVQNSWPRRLLGASTPGMGMQVHDYAIADGVDCLKCHNPLPRGATRAEAVERLRRLPPAERLVEGQRIGLSIDDIADLDAVECAQLGAIDLAKVDGDRPAFAISFVTAISGFLAAACVLRAGSGPFTHAGTGHSTYFNVLTPDLTLRDGRPRRGCDCGGSGGDLYRELW